ncbi:oxidoreductase [Tilletiaria anomala UBC 951]|uniref:Oxidoreductase n=1 Tax=Tilletiaria anomala (strain ATCC 24038 / CBS 436.72 / UBC 951) TaxID=1037660 RepID=A0A066WN30_TILAU|nr:oxidoreductase [Tilletiaria anomala UBC 951]KDN52040.1 oxidoreductase [Tilletiaria anomala UBC 951]
MLRTPQEVVTSGISNEPEIFTLFSMRGRSAIVTGGARGLGITLASALVEAGADVYCCDILPEPSPEEWKALQNKAANLKVRVQYRQMDITNAEQTADVFASIEEEIQHNASEGKIKLLRAVIACAATQQEVPAIDYLVEDFERMMRINVTGTFITCQAAARNMSRHGKGGSIVVIGSMSGRVANRGIACSAYNATKAAVNQLTRNLACEWAADKIRVNSISPGYIHTAMLNSLLKANPQLLGLMQSGNPMHRVAKPHEFKGAAVFLASDASSFTTGTDLLIDGGHCAW